MMLKTDGNAEQIIMALIDCNERVFFLRIKLIGDLMLIKYIGGVFCNGACG